MATKKTTKAKPKTSQITKKSVSAKVTVKESKSTKTSNLLSRLNLVSALVFIVLAVLAGLLIKDTYYQLTANYLVKDELVRDAEVLLPAVRNVYDLNIRWALVAVLAVSAIAPLLALTWLKSTYTKSVGNKVQTLRWIDSAVTWAVFIELIALLSGAHNIMTMKLIAVLAAITMLLGWLSERQNKTAVDRAPFVIGVFTGLAVVIAIGMALANTYVWGLINLPWYTYAAAAIAVVGLALWQFNHFNYLRGFRNWKNYEVVERNYLIINLATKSLIALALILGL